MRLDTPQSLILEKSPTGYCVIGAQGDVRWMNSALSRYIDEPISHIQLLPLEISSWIESRLDYAIRNSDSTEKQIFFRDWGALHLQPLEANALKEDWLLSFPTLKPASDRESIFHETVFQACPIPMCVEDFSSVRRYLRDSLSKDITDLRSHLQDNVDLVRKLADLVIIKDVNSAALEIMKFKKEDVVGRLTRTLGEATYPAFIEELVAISEGRTHLEIETPINTKNRHLNQTRIYIRFPEDPEHYTNVFVTIVDIDPYIAERRSLEEQREHAIEVSRSKSEFVASLSHEMRTPLNGIIGFAELLSLSHQEKDSNEFLASILSCSKTLQHLIDDVLDFTKIEAGEMQIRNKPFAICDVINEIAQVFRLRIQSAGIQFDLNIDKNLAKNYWGDPLRIIQILNNLLSNAEKFTTEGYISVEARESPSSDEIQFMVKDTGVGIDESALEHVFKPFKQAESFTFERYGGTGLGLAISLRFAKMMQGTLSIEPGVPRGTVAILQLPLLPVETPIENSKTPYIENSPEDSGKIHLLAVDDNKINLRLISYLLKHRKDIDVELVSSGEAAIETLKAQTFDAILMDLQMPGLDGFDTTRKIRNGEAGVSHTKIPIAALTAHTTADNRKRASDCGMDAFIEKPMKPKEVFRFLREFTQAT